MLRMTSSSRIQAESDVSDYMGFDYQPKTALKHQEPKHVEKIPFVNNESNGNPVRDKVRPIVTSGDLLDCLDFPGEEMQSFHALDQVHGMLTPRTPCVSLPRTPGNATPRSLTPRSLDG